MGDADDCKVDPDTINLALLPPNADPHWEPIPVIVDGVFVLGHGEIKTLPRGGFKVEIDAETAEAVQAEYDRRANATSTFMGAPPEGIEGASHGIYRLNADGSVDLLGWIDNRGESTAAEAAATAPDGWEQEGP